MKDLAIVDGELLMDGVLRMKDGGTSSPHKHCSSIRTSQLQLDQWGMKRVRDESTKPSPGGLWIILIGQLHKVTTAVAVVAVQFKDVGQDPIVVHELLNRI